MQTTSFKRSKNLLSISADSKTIKGEKIGYLTGILYLAPANTTKYNTCSMAHKAQCAVACLYSAGRGAFNNVQQSRIDKTLYFYEARDELVYLLNEAKKVVEKYSPAINALSSADDLDFFREWDNFGDTLDNLTYNLGE